MNQARSPVIGVMKAIGLVAGALIAIWLFWLFVGMIFYVLTLALGGSAWVGIPLAIVFYSLVGFVAFRVGRFVWRKFLDE